MMATNPDGQVKDTWHIRKGSTFTRQYQWKTRDNNVDTPVNITGWTIRSMVKDTYGGTVIFDLSTLGAGIVVTDAVNGIFSITITSAQTDAVEFNKGVFDIELTDNITVKNLIGGNVVFYKQVTT